MNITKDEYAELVTTVNLKGYIHPKSPAYLEYLDMLDKIEKYEALEKTKPVNLLQTGV